MRLMMIRRIGTWMRKITVQRRARRTRTRTRRRMWDIILLFILPVCTFVFLCLVQATPLLQPAKIFDFCLKEKGWEHVNGSGLYTNKFVYKNIKGGERGMHYAMDDEELGRMIEKYGMDHSPEDPNHQYVALPLEDQKTVEKIHDELFPKKTGINADKKREADLSNINKEAKKKKKQKKMNPPPVTTAPTMAAFHFAPVNKDTKKVKEIHYELFPDKKREADVSILEKEEAKKKKQKKMNPPPVTTAPTPAAFPRVSMSPSSGGNAGGCNAAMGSSSLDEASGHSPDTAVGRSPDAPLPPQR